MKKSKFFFLAISSLALIFTNCSDNDNTPNEEMQTSNTSQINLKIKKAKIKYPFSLTTLKDEKIEVNKINRGFSFSGTEGKAVLLVFFTSWCPPCKAEIPHLNSLQKRYNKDLQIISITLEDKDLDFMQSFAKQKDIIFKVTYGEENFKMAKAVGDVQAIPFMILYDKEGKYATHYVGAVMEEMMDVDISKVIGK